MGYFTSNSVKHVNAFSQTLIVQQYFLGNNGFNAIVPWIPPLLIFACFVDMSTEMVVCSNDFCKSSADPLDHFNLIEDYSLGGFFLQGYHHLGQKQHC